MTTDSWLEDERKKYEAVWGYEFYRKQADGDPVVNLAFVHMGCKRGESLIDWGCGRGTPAQAFQRLGLDVRGFDIAHNCLSPGVNIPLAIGCLWESADTASMGQVDYSFCTDVLEHLPPTKLADALDNIAAATRKAAFIQVCTAADTSGKKMNPPMKLHLSVMPDANWEALLKMRWGWVGKIEIGGKQRVAFICKKLRG